MINVTVQKDGRGDFTSINDALSGILPESGEKVIIHLKKGVYREKVRIENPFVNIIGEDVTATIITYDDYAKKILNNGTKLGTFNSYTLYIGGNDFYAENITVKNTAGSGEIAGQAVAVCADADKVVFKNCKFIACQDTLYTGPMPANPVPAGVNPIYPFAGYGDYVVNHTFRQYYENCFIQGDIDFIFGSATAVFYKCIIKSNNRHENINGYITAASTFPNAKFGYVFIECELISDASPGTVYLGRPWRVTAKTVFVNCYLGEHIHSLGWHDWDNANARETVFYAECCSYGPGAKNPSRPDWVNILQKEQISVYYIEHIFTGDDAWNPNSVIHH